MTLSFERMFSRSPEREAELAKEATDTNNEIRFDWVSAEATNRVIEILADYL